VQNSRDFGMQQTEARRTDLARSTNYNIQNKDYYKKNRSVAIKHTSEVSNRRGSSIYTNGRNAK